MRKHVKNKLCEHLTSARTKEGRRSSVREKEKPEKF